MSFEPIRCYTSADIKALQQTRTDEVVFLDLVSLESVRVARESYAVLHELLVPRNWLCGDLDLLSLVAGVSLELHKINHDLLPRFLVQEVKLDGDVLEALLVLKNSAIALLDLAKEIKEEIDDVDEDLISCKVERLGMSLLDTANLVLISDANIDSLQERVRALVGPIDALLAAPFVFHSE
ncbi:unnamed protein product [Urochloa decumbens]|uniref:Uncharacterized protein n=1 Tax=Urochloa decumbens TaxID=240449 RepID=A0ABC9FYK3_9POAL